MTESLVSRKFIKCFSFCPTSRLIVRNFPWESSWPDWYNIDPEVVFLQWNFHFFLQFHSASHVLNWGLLWKHWNFLVEWITLLRSQCNLFSSTVYINQENLNLSQKSLSKHAAMKCLQVLLPPLLPLLLPLHLLPLRVIRWQFCPEKLPRHQNVYFLAIKKWSWARRPQSPAQSSSRTTIFQY